VSRVHERLFRGRTRRRRGFELNPGPVDLKSGSLTNALIMQKSSNAADDDDDNDDDDDDVHDRANTSPMAAFSGSMQLLAGVKLCTGRPITNHPHYEHKALRHRTKEVTSSVQFRNSITRSLQCRSNKVAFSRLWLSNNTNGDWRLSDL